MGGGVDAAIVKIEADGGGHFAIELLLLRDGGLSEEEVGGDFFRSGHRLGGDVGEVAFEGIEEGGNFGGGGGAFVAGEEGGVGFVIITPEVGFLAGDF